MRHPQHSENEKDVKAEESIFQSPRVALLSTRGRRLPV